MKLNYLTNLAGECDQLFQDAKKFGMKESPSESSRLHEIKVLNGTAKGVYNTWKDKLSLDDHPLIETRTQYRKDIEALQKTFTKLKVSHAKKLETKYCKCLRFDTTIKDQVHYLGFKETPR